MFGWTLLDTDDTFCGNGFDVFMLNVNVMLCTTVMLCNVKYTLFFMLTYAMSCYVPQLRYVPYCHVYGITAMAAVK